MSRYAQREEENDQQFHALANKLSALRSVTEEINGHAQHSETINNLSDTMTNIMANVKNSSTRLTRSMGMGNSIWRNVGIALALFFIVWTIMKIF